MYCIHCGESVQPDQRFCGNCGRILGSESSAPPAPAAAPRSSRPTWLIPVAIGVVFLCLIVLVGGFFLFTPLSGILIPPSATSMVPAAKLVETSVAETKTHQALSAPTTEVPPTPSQTPSQTPTSTVSLTPSPTLSPTPERVEVRVSENTNCRAGPASNYDPLGQLLTDEVALVVGKNTELNYWVIIEPSYEVECWLWGRYSEISGDPTLVPEMTPPPSPTPKLLPQACDGVAHYGPLQVGSVVILGKHREVNGDANWNPGMDQYVGKQTKVTSLDGVDQAGCTGVSVAIDNGSWFWRVRDMKLP